MTRLHTQTGRLMRYHLHQLRALRTKDLKSDDTKAAAFPSQFSTPCSLHFAFALAIPFALGIVVWTPEMMALLSKIKETTARCAVDTQESMPQVVVVEIRCCGCMSIRLLLRQPFLQFQLGVDAWKFKHS